MVVKFLFVFVIRRGFGEVVENGRRNGHQRSEIVCANADAERSSSSVFVVEYGLRGDVIDQRGIEYHVIVNGVVAVVVVAVMIVDLQFQVSILQLICFVFRDLQQFHDVVWSDPCSVNHVEYVLLCVHLV